MAEQNRLAVTTFDGLVVLHVETPQEYMPLDSLSAIAIGTKLIGNAVDADHSTAQVAIDASMALMDWVYDVRKDIKPVGGAAKHELVERHRMVLTQRVSVMLNSLREDKTKGNGAVAKAIVDAVIAEVF